MRKIRTYNEVDAGTESGILEQVLEQRERLKSTLSGVGCVVAVASGKGGVGKSLVTANLAEVLSRRGLRVGAVDADLNGPSLARMLGVVGQSLGDGEEGIAPAVSSGGVKVISMELLQAVEDAPVRWKDPGSERFVWQSTLETGVLREFLSDVAWGDLDFLLVDVPPGTDKITRLLELVPDMELALLVTTPSEITRFVVSKSVRLVREGGSAHVALVANMTEFVTPDGSRMPLFTGDGARRLAEETGLPMWGEIPFDPRLGAATDTGGCFVVDEPDSAAARAISILADRVSEFASEGERPPAPGDTRTDAKSNGASDDRRSASDPTEAP